jgi:hypothetical protein
MVRDLQQTVCILDAVAQHMEAVAKCLAPRPDLPEASRSSHYS